MRLGWVAAGEVRPEIVHRAAFGEYWSVAGRILRTCPWPKLKNPDLVTFASVIDQPNQSTDCQVSRLSLRNDRTEAIKEAAKELNVAENLRDRIEATKENY